MTTVHTNRLAADYLRRLEQAAAPLARSRQAELVAEIRAPIDDALLEAGAADEVAVRNVLERLGLAGRSARSTSALASGAPAAGRSWPQPDAASAVAKRSWAMRAQ